MILIVETPLFIVVVSVSFRFLNDDHQPVDENHRNSTVIVESILSIVVVALWFRFLNSDDDRVDDNNDKSSLVVKPTMLMIVSFSFRRCRSYSSWLQLEEVFDDFGLFFYSYDTDAWFRLYDWLSMKNIIWLLIDIVRRRRQCLRSKKIIQDRRELLRLEGAMDVPIDETYIIHCFLSCSFLFATSLPFLSFSQCLSCSLPLHISLILSMSLSSSSSALSRSLSLSPALALSFSPPISLFLCSSLPLSLSHSLLISRFCLLLSFSWKTYIFSQSVSW